MLVLVVFCFFFQAEDGIRDRNVTGVQTCALPISSPSSRLRASRAFASLASRPLKRAVVRCRSRRLPFLFCAIRSLLSAVFRPPVHRIPPPAPPQQRVLSASVFCIKNLRFLYQKRKKSLFQRAPYC